MQIIYLKDNCSKQDMEIKNLIDKCNKKTSTEEEQISKYIDEITTLKTSNTKLKEKLTENNNKFLLELINIKNSLFDNKKYMEEDTDDLDQVKMSEPSHFSQFSLCK